MSIFDRGVFIFIGLGIWLLALSQFTKPSIAEALEKSGILDSGWSHDGQLDQKLIAVLIQMLMASDSLED